MIVADIAATRNQEPIPIEPATLVRTMEPDEVVVESARSEGAILFDTDVPRLPFADSKFRPPAPAVADAVFPPRALDYSWREPWVVQVAAWLRVLLDQDQVAELRALNVAFPNGTRGTFSGFYNGEGRDQMADDALELTPDAEGVYFGLNPLDKSLLARRFNKVAQAKDTAADADVLKRRWLLVDADPVRKAGISATDEEKGQAWKTVGAVFRWLREQGWPDPVVADSGNGYHLLHRIDLPCDDGGLVKSVLLALAKQFDTERVKIDTKVFNPSRIVKLYGTLARKGESIRERPHRWTGVLSVPQELVAVSREQLEALGGPVVREAVKVEMPWTPNLLIAGQRSDLLQRARSYLKKVPPAISSQGGHNQTFKAACILTLRFGLTEEEAMPLFQEWNETCQPPWEEKDLRKKLRDAATKVAVPTRLDRGTGGEGKAGADQDGQVDVPVPVAREAVDDPHRLAQLFLSEGRAKNGEVTLRFWNGDWFRWDGIAYRQVSDGEVRAGLTRTIKEEFDRVNLLERWGPAIPGSQGEGEPTREPNARKVTSRLVGDVLQAVRSECFVSGAVQPPAWLDGKGPFEAGEVLVARNGLVHLPSFLEGQGDLRPLTPNLFTTVALDYEIDRNAGMPAAWLDFLNGLWPGDAESVDVLQEWFGYCLTQDTGQQKMLLVVGPKRAGKGTIARVLTALAGQANVAGPTLCSLAGNFGLSALLNKPVAILSDARFSGRSAEQAVVVERLLSISGEDTLTIDRKNREHLTVKLPTRFTILTNELPRLMDASAALPSRLLVLQLTRSWYGAEDITLGQRLLAERPGIFLWAVEGLRRLRQRGRFVQPSSGLETANRMVELSSPVTAFVQDCCQVDRGLNVAKGTLFETWRQWCANSGHEPGSQATFGRNLLAAFPEVQSSRPREGVARIMTYAGLGLRRL